MPMSLWLVPYEKCPFEKTMIELSETVQSNFLTPDEILHFRPHITLTSDIESEKVLGQKSPQDWLDQLPLPDFKAEWSEVVLELDRIEAEDPFYRKMNIAVKDNDNLTKLAVTCRREGTLESEEKAQAWAKNEYRPHLSLLYADVPTQDVQNKVPLIEMKIGFAVGDLFACCGGTLCMGGHLVLVDTNKPVKEWQPIASRETPWAMWRATKNLI